MSAEKKEEEAWFQAVMTAGTAQRLGVAVNGSPSGLRLGSASAFANSLDESLRRLQWTPMLQLGLSYRF